MIRLPIFQKPLMGSDRAQGPSSHGSHNNICYIRLGLLSEERNIRREPSSHACNILIENYDPEILHNVSLLPWEVSSIMRRRSWPRQNHALRRGSVNNRYKSSHDSHNKTTLNDKRQKEVQYKFLSRFLGQRSGLAGCTPR